MSGQFRIIPAAVALLVFLAGGLGTLALAAWVWRVASGNGWLAGRADAALGSGNGDGEGLERVRAGCPGA